MSWWQIGAAAMGSFTESKVIYKKVPGQLFPTRSPATSNGKMGAVFIRSTTDTTGTPLVSVHYGTNQSVNFNSDDEGGKAIQPVAGVKVSALAGSLGLNADLEVVYLQ